MNETKDRLLKNLKTTIPGVMLLLLAGFLIFSRIMFISGRWENGNISIREIVITITLGYALISAKDSLIGGMFGILKLFIKK